MHRNPASWTHASYRWIAESAVVWTGEISHRGSAAGPSFLLLRLAGLTADSRQPNPISFLQDLPVGGNLQAIGGGMSEKQVFGKFRLPVQARARLTFKFRIVF